VGLLCVIVALGWILYNPGDALFGLAGGLLLVCAIWLVFGLLRGGLHRRPPR
jgi:hypothetical protein